MASFIRSNVTTDAFYVRIGKRDDVDALEANLRQYGIVVECACDTELLCYMRDSTYRDEQLKTIVKTSSSRK